MPRSAYKKNTLHAIATEKFFGPHEDYEVLPDVQTPYLPEDLSATGSRKVRSKIARCRTTDPNCPCCAGSGTVKVKAHADPGGDESMTRCLSAFSRDSLRLMLDEDKDVMPHTTYVLWSAMLEYADKEAQTFKIMGLVDAGEFSLSPKATNR